MFYKVGFLTSKMSLMGCVMKLCEQTIVKCSYNDFFQSKEAKMLEIELKRKTIGLYIHVNTILCAIIFKM